MTTAPAAATLADLSGTWTIDPSHSRIGFVARHAMVTKVRGAFNEVEGTVVVDGANLPASSATVTLQVASVDTRSEQRDAHLVSDDFFSAGTYPTITFVSTAVEPTGPTSLELTGDLTIKDVTRPVAIPFDFEGAATDPFGNQRAGFEGSVVVKRADYGLTWNAALETGGVLVSDKITLEFEVSLIKSA